MVRRLSPGALRRHETKTRMSDPAFPLLKPVGLDDRPLIEEFLRRFPSEACELNFANIFIWRDSEKPRFTLLNGNLCLFLEPDFEPPYALPPLGRTALRETVAACLDRVPRLSRVTEDIVPELGDGFCVEEDRDNFDYLYLASELGGLSGKKFDGKRNRIKKFESSCAHEYVALGPHLLDDCRRLFEEWFGTKNHDPYLQAEKAAILEGLDHFEALGLRGAAILVDGRVRAFTYGTLLTPGTAVIQVEIADPALPGLAQYINREFVRRAWPDARFVNREQDVGVPGLRKAKLSYQPCRLVRKFNVRPR